MRWWQYSLRGLRGLIGSLGLFAALLLVPTWGLAQEFGWQVSPDQPQVGDRVQVTLALLHSDTVAPDWAAIAPEFAGGEVDPEVITETVVDGDGKRRSWRTYTLHVDLPGDLSLPSLSLPVGKATLAVAALSVPIKGAFDADNPPPLAGPKGPLSVAAPWWPFAAAAAALLALLAGLWWRLKRRPKKVPPPAPVVPPRPAHLLALERLEQLDPAWPPRQFFGELSAITCDYIAARHDIAAPAMSREEILAAIAQNAGQNGHELSPVPSWLEDWELFKFARVAPEDGRHQADLNAVQAWVVALSSQPVQVDLAAVVADGGRP